MNFWIRHFNLRRWLSIYTPVSLLCLSACKQSDAPLPAGLAEITGALDGFAPLARSSVEAAAKQLAEKPDDAERNGRLAMILHGHELFTAAEIYYRRAERLAPGDFRWPYLLGHVLIQTARADEAPIAWRRALALKPDYFPLLVAIGEDQLRRGEVADAGKLFGDLCQTDSAPARAWLGLGRSLMQLKEWTSAEAALRRAVEISPDSRAPRYVLATALSAQGKREAAQRELASLQGLTVELPPLDDPILTDAERTGIGQQAMLSFTEAGQCFDQGRFREAKRMYQDILRLNPEYVPALCQLGATQTLLGEVDEAIAVLERATRLNPRHAYSAGHLGLALNQAGRYESAIPHLRKAIELDPFLVDAYISLGVALEATGHDEEAVRQLREAIELEARQTFARLQLGRLLHRIGRTEEAVAVLKAGLPFDDERKSIRSALDKMEHR